MTPTLDPVFYPHLIDAIFADADAHALLRLRAASRDWRDRANGLLSTHLVFFAKGPVCAAVRGDIVPHPAFHSFPHTTPNLSLCPSPQPLPTSPAHGQTLSPDEQQLGPCYWTEAMASNHVVDWVGLRDSYLTPTGFFDRAPRFMRMWENGVQVRDSAEEPPTAETVVVFAWPRAPFDDPGACVCSVRFEQSSWQGQGQGEGLGHGNEEEDDGSDPVDDATAAADGERYTPFNYLASGTRKLVINVSPPSRAQRQYGFIVSTFEVDYLEACGTLEILINIALPKPDKEAFEDSPLPTRVADALLAVIEDEGLIYTFVNATVPAGKAGRGAVRPLGGR